VWNAAEPDKGLGLELEIGTLDVPEGLGLIIHAPAFGLDNVYRPLVNVGSGSNAKLIFSSNGDNYPEDGSRNNNADNTEGHKLWGKHLPDSAPDPEDEGKEKAIATIDVRLGWEDTNGRWKPASEGEMTMREVKPGSTIRFENARAKMLFGWEKMSVKPQPSEDENSDLPTYPFTGSFPEDDEGIDLSDMPTGLVFNPPEALKAQLYISLERGPTPPSGGKWEKDPPQEGWDTNLDVDLPNLEFYVKYGKDGSEDNRSGNLFAGLAPKKGTDAWALSKPLGEFLKVKANPESSEYAIMKDPENGDNPFKLYTASELPEPGKAIPMKDLGAALNRVLSGEKKERLFFDYTATLAGNLDEATGEVEDGEILLYPSILEKTLKVSADLLIIVSMKFKASPYKLDESNNLVIVDINSDLGNSDLFGRTPNDNGYFDDIKFLGFDITSKNVLGLKAGEIYLENGHERGSFKPQPIFNLAGGSSSLFLNEDELKANNPFIPKLSIRLKPGDTVEIERGFSVKLESITVRVGGEHTFDTGL
jgi:hypothetical protein